MQRVDIVFFCLVSIGDSDGSGMFMGNVTVQAFLCLYKDPTYPAGFFVESVTSTCFFYDLHPGRINILEPKNHQIEKEYHLNQTAIFGVPC